MLLVQQKQEEYIKQLASKVDVLTTHNKMLEDKIAQQATFSSTPTGRLLSKREPNPREQCNCVTLKGGKEDSKVMEFEEGEEVHKIDSEVKNAEIETPRFGGVSDVVVPEEFPHKLKNPRSFSIPCMVGKVRIDRALYNPGASVSLMPIPWCRSLVQVSCNQPLFYFN